MSKINAADYTAHQLPGKFEGTTPAVEYFYGQMCNGDGETTGADDDTSGCSATLFMIDADEADAFDLKLGAWFLLIEDSYGFVSGSVFDERHEAEKACQIWVGADDL